VREVLAQLDDAIPMGRITTLEDMLARDRGPMAFTMVLIVIAGASALALGLVGIYGVISYAVSQRTGEIGVRIALGAQPGDVSRMILRQGTFVATSGLVVGLVGAVTASRFMEALLFQMSPTDPATYASVAAGLLVVSLLACWLPARRAARLDPVRALRSE
jgi:ABC-type antimicrobial peptide transport system permease subunit